MADANNIMNDPRLQHLGPFGQVYGNATEGGKAVLETYIESQKWGEDDQGFKITAPTEP